MAYFIHGFSDPMSTECAKRGNLISMHPNFLLDIFGMIQLRFFFSRSLPWSPVTQERAKKQTGW